MWHPCKVASCKEGWEVKGGIGKGLEELARVHWVHWVHWLAVVQVFPCRQASYFRSPFSLSLSLTSMHVHECHMCMSMGLGCVHLYKALA